MALPVFRAQTATKASGTGAVSPALPTGLVANDLCILVASTIAGGSISITTAGSITWTAVSGSPVDVTGGEKLYVWWGRYSSGSTAPTVTPGSDHCLAGIMAYSGCCNGSGVIGVTASGTEVTSDTSFSFVTGISSAVDDCLAACVVSTGVSSNSSQFTNSTNAALGGLGSARLNFATNSGGGGGFGVFTGSKVTAGSLGTWTATLLAASAKSYLVFTLVPLYNEGAGSSTGSCTVSADGQAATGTTILQADASATGSCTVSGAARSTAGVVASSTGLATVSGDGQATSSGIVAVDGSSAGVATVTGGGAVFNPAQFSSTGSCITSIGTQTLQVIGRDGSSAGTVTVTGASGTVSAATGSSVGSCTVTGAAAARAITQGSSSGLAITSIGTQTVQVIGRDGSAGGLATASATSSAISSTQGSTSGSTVILGDGQAITAGPVIIEGTGTAQGSSSVLGDGVARGPVEATGDAQGLAFVFGFGGVAGEETPPALLGGGGLHPYYRRKKKREFEEEVVLGLY